MDEEDQHRVAPRAGRRARAQARQETAEEEDSERQQDPQEGQQEDDRPSPAPRRGGFGFDAEAEEGEGGGAPPPPASAIGGFGENNIPRPPPEATLDGGGAKPHAGVSRRKADQRVREEEEKERVQSKYDDMADKGNVDGIMEIEEEGREDMSNMVGAAMHGAMQVPHGAMHGAMLRPLNWEGGETDACWIITCMHGS